VGKLGKDILDKMRKSVEDIPFHEKNKVEIKEEIRDWEEEKILKEILLMNNNERSSVNSYSHPEKIKELFTIAVRNKERIERHKHKQALHGIRAEIYREFLKEEGYDPGEIIEKACDERDDLEARTEADLEKVEIELPDRGDLKWYYT